MSRTADMLEIFQQYHGDAIVEPGRDDVTRSRSARSPVGMPRRVTRPWAVMRGSLRLALAQPEKKVIVFSFSQGDLLMNLGILPTTQAGAQKFLSLPARQRKL